MANPQHITRPWVIVHAPEGKRETEFETILAAPPDIATWQHFALIAADLIRHTARAFGKDPAEVLAMVNREMEYFPDTTKRKTDA